MLRCLFDARLCALLVVCFALVPRVAGQVEHGSIDVVENDGQNNPSSVTLSRAGGDGPWTIGHGDSNRGDYYVDFGTGSDTSAGVLITAPYQTERSEPSVAQDPYFATITTAPGSGNRYFIPVHEAPTGDECNFNPAFAWFPLADGWMAGAGYNSTNNGPLSTLVGHPDLRLRDDATFTGQGFEFHDQGGNNGFYRISLQGYDLRRDGVVLVCGAKNEDNRAAVHVSHDGTATINCIDNGAESGGENDPAAFVLIPEGTPGVVMGRVTGSARTLFAQGEFDVTLMGQAGTFRVNIAGESPATGTLLACPHTELSGLTVDNALFVQPDGDGWLIQTRDIEPLPDGLQLQNLDSGEVAFHFAFFRNGVAIEPVEPPREYKRRLNDLVAARIAVTEFNAGNGLGDMRAERCAGSDAIGIYADNRGDVGLSYLGARPAAELDYGLDALEGVILGTPTEFFRDNSATGGVSGWSTLGFDNGRACTHKARGTAEINSNFAVARFPASLGLLQAADVSAADGTATVLVGNDAMDDGVLLAVNWDNNNRVVSATPAGDRYEITAYEGADGSVATDSVEVGYVHVPYSLPGVVAGQIAADATIVSGRGVFAAAPATHELGFGVTRIHIPGIDAHTDGVLLVTATDGAYAMAWEPATSGGFDVAGLNLVTNTPERAGFAFVYVPFELACPGCIGDLDGDCVVMFDDAATLLAALDGGGAMICYDCDLTQDGIIDLADVATLQALAGADCDELLPDPQPPTLVAPYDGGTIQGPNANLMVNVTDRDGDPVDVQFYGRALNDAEPFSIVLLPDTQNYSENYPAIFTAQTQWIVDNRDALNIRYVAHLGDIVQTANIIPEWENADDALSILDTQPDLPYGLCVGNHDQWPMWDPEGTQYYNMYFPETRYEGMPWYGGHYGGDNDNHYCFFNGGGMNFVALHLEYDASANPALLAWADDVLDQFSHCRAMVFTHYLVRTGHPAAFGPQGGQVYQALKDKPNLFLMHGGHICGEGRREDLFEGRTVYSLLADYQCRSQGGDGWLRILEFRPAENMIQVKTYSPWLNRWEYDIDSAFLLPYDMSGTTFEQVGIANDVPSGANAVLTWSGLGSGPYEWYVVAQTSAGPVQSERWRFNVE